jgi:DNA end-binding protein Ku
VRKIGEAVALIEAMTRDDLTGPEFTDHYSEALHEVIEGKREDRQLPQAPEPEARPGPLVDLIAMYRRRGSEPLVQLLKHGLGHFLRIISLTR